MKDHELLERLSQAEKRQTKRLYLSGKQLSALPVEVGRLSCLTSLFLAGNQITSFPVEICALENLTSLNLSGNQMTFLPPEIGQLTNLERLDLSGNQLTTLPPEIGQLRNIARLELSGNQLSSLPKEIAQMSSLEKIDLSGNQLSSLPQEMFELPNLTDLILIENQLVSLPSEIGQLKSLEKADFSGNLLESLPAGIGKLKNLTKLNLSANRLASLPAEIGQLSSLVSLFLSENRLTELPEEIGLLTDLQRLYLHDNPLVTPPVEIAAQGVESVRDYLRQIMVEEKDYIYEAKLIIVGEAGAGKTTLSKKIKDHKYELKNEVSTQGIEVIQWKYKIDDKKDFVVNIWDFGGQEIYHTTHQFFLTKRSLYVLVADTRNEDTDFYYWCNIVSLLSENSPLLIVKNEKQDRHRDINARQLRGEFTNLKEIMATNLATNRGLPIILENIKSYTKALPHIGTALPKTWIKVREILEQNRHRNYISLQEYMEICEDMGFRIRRDKLQLSRFLHDLGVCLHFQEDPILKRTVIINPEWGTDAVYQVLDNDNVIRNLGKFTKSNLESIWSDDKYIDMQDDLLQLMIKFKLCYKIPGTRSQYIAPQLLTENQPEYDWDSDDNLHLRYTYKFMPKGILTRFIVSLHDWIDEQKYVWRSGVILSQDNAKAEVIENVGLREIKIRVTGPDKKELVVIVAHELDKIHASYNRLRYDKLIPCNCSVCKKQQEPNFFPYQVLLKFRKDGQRKIQCQESYEMVDPNELIDGISIVRKKNKVFISYSHEDRKWLKVILKMLQPVIKEERSIIWADTDIRSGARWRKEIDDALHSAKVAVLLVSPGFLSSDFIEENELTPILRAASMEGIRILWIPVSPSLYEETEIADYQAVSDPEKPLDSLSSSELKKTMVDICKEIANACRD